MTGTDEKVRFMKRDNLFQKENNKKYSRIIAACVPIIILICVTIGVFFYNSGKKNDGSNDTTGDFSTDTSSRVDKTEWNLILVNRRNPLPKDYAVNLAALENGHAVDERCYSDLRNMMDDCRGAGLNPLICSSYRTQEKQEELFSNQVSKWKARGYSEEEAKKEAGRIVAVPGTGEHQSGLALDIVDMSNQNLDESQEKTEVQKWLMQNSWKYGFILRYPNDKSDITGIIYEPWHYRYVGKKAAKEIYESGICLEEYLEQ